MLQDRFGALGAAGVPIRRAAPLYPAPRAVCRCDDGALRGRLREISRERPRWGYRRAHATLRQEGWEVNRKRVQRLWREEGPLGA